MNHLSGMTFRHVYQNVKPILTKGQQARVEQAMREINRQSMKHHQETGEKLDYNYRDMATTIEGWITKREAKHGQIIGRMGFPQ